MLYNLPRTSIGFKFIIPTSLLMIKGIGWQCNVSPKYIWNGRTRGKYIWHGKKHTDEHCLFQYTLSGEGEIEIEGKIYTLKQGDAFIVEIPGNHCYKLPQTSKKWEIIYIEFSKEALPFWHQLLTMTEPVFSMGSDSDFINLVWSIYELAIKNEIYNVYQCSKYAYQLIMELISYFYQDQKSKPLPSKIELCKQFIDIHYAEQIGLDDMSQHVGISKFYLTRLFNKELRMTPTDYLIKVRLENSLKVLIFSTDLTLDEVAQRVGFSSGNYFGKVFKKTLGISPAEFRRNSDSYEIHRILFEKLY